MTDDHTDDHTDDVQDLRTLSFFGALKRETILFLRERCVEESVKAGGAFFQQGEMGDSVYVLRTGRVAVIRSLEGESLVLGEFGPGFCFGEMALVAIRARNASVRAMEDSMALRLRNLALLELYKHDLEQFTLLQMNLGREVARRLAIADDALFEYAKRLGETETRIDLLSRATDAIS